MFPEIAAPFFVTPLDMAVPMYAGREVTGDELLPGELVQLPPHTGGVELSASANPLKADGAEPPLRPFCLAHCAPQNVRVAPVAWSPRMKMPRLGNAKTIRLLLASADGR